MKKKNAVLASMMATLLLAACGGDGDATNNNGGNGGGNGGTPAAPAALKPLDGGSLYVGAVSFGDTVSVELDAPSAGQLTIRFLDSRYGLAGSLVGTYMATEDGYRVSGLAAADDAVPAALAAAAGHITFEFTLADGVLSGALGQVPNVAAGNGALLQGQVSAANRGASLPDIAGVYSYIRQAGNTAGIGQLKVSADGSVVVCDGQAFADACAGAQRGTVAPDANQDRFPGAFSVALGGNTIGRLFVARQDGQTVLFIDEAANAADGSERNGAWTLTQARAAASLDGDWLCAEPELGADHAPTGRTQRNIVSIGGTTLAADNIPGDVALRYDAAFSAGAAAPALTHGAPGLVSGIWQASVDGSPVPTALALLPAGGKLAYQIRQVPGTQRYIQGACVPMAAETPTTGYLNAEAGDIVLATLADLRPTQPAIGFDQIYYKQGRYILDPAKKFDDACETNGQNKARTPIPFETARLDNLASFECTKTVGNKPQDMKTMVIGPNGKPYLTDGHHAMTTVWESPDGGPNAKMHIRVQDNLSSLSRAAFFRTLRERKLVWLKDATNTPITPAQLPVSLGLKNGLGNDPYRSLVYFTRDIGYAQLDDATEFTEFYWGDWLRQRVKLSDYNVDDVPSYLSAVRVAATAMVALAPADLVSSGKTAASLGRMDTFDEEEFAALSQPLTAAKPGKLPYAVHYRLGLIPLPE